MKEGWSTQVLFWEILHVNELHISVLTVGYLRGKLSLSQTQGGLLNQTLGRRATSGGLQHTPPQTTDTGILNI